MIAYFATDLLWATRIKSTAEDLGIPARPVRDITMLDARLGDSPVRGLIVDLDNPEMALPMIRRVREWEAHADRSPLRVVAFGPHVESAALGEARRCGADSVLTRGAFHSGLAEIIRELEGETSRDDRKESVP